MKTTFEDMMKEEESNSYSSKMEYKYFSMKPGESSTVRIMLDSVNDFDMEIVHNVKLSNGNTKKISCLGNHCPLCEAGVKQTKRIFIPMIKYSGSDGNITGEPVVWDRDKEWAMRLRNYLNDYGPLSEILCNISREGTGLDTKYTPSPNVHTRDAANYPRVAFPDVEPSKYCVSNKTAEEMQEFIATGEFPQRTYNNQATTTVADAPVNEPMFDNPAPSYDAPTYTAPTQTYSTPPTQQVQQFGNRPRRY